MKQINVFGAIICALYASFGVKSGFALYALFQGAAFSGIHAAAIAYAIGFGVIAVLVATGRFSLKYFIFRMDEADDEKRSP